MDYRYWLCVILATGFTLVFAALVLIWRAVLGNSLTVYRQSVVGGKLLSRLEKTNEMGRDLAATFDQTGREIKPLVGALDRLQKSAEEVKRMYNSSSNNNAE